MPLARTADLVAAAHCAGTGLAAFNVITLEHAEAIIAGAEQAGRPVILQISENAVKFHHGRLRPITTAVTAVAAEAAIPASVHLDHVEDRELLYASAETGASSAMFDASKLDYQAHLAATAARAAAKTAPTPPVCAPTPPKRQPSSPPPGSTPWPSRWAARMPCRRAPPPWTLS